MAAASDAGLALWRHMILLVSIYNEKAEGSQVYLSCYLNIDGNTKEKRKYNLPLVSSPDVETLCHCMLEFDDVSAVLDFYGRPVRKRFVGACLAKM